MSENTAEGRDFRSSIYNAETDGKIRSTFNIHLQI